MLCACESVDMLCACESIDMLCTCACESVNYMLCAHDMLWVCQRILHRGTSILKKLFFSIQ